MVESRIRAAGRTSADGRARVLTRVSDSAFTRSRFTAPLSAAICPGLTTHQHRQPDTALQILVSTWPFGFFLACPPPPLSAFRVMSTLTVAAPYARDGHREPSTNGKGVDSGTSLAQGYGLPRIKDRKPARLGPRCLSSRRDHLA